MAPPYSYNFLWGVKDSVTNGHFTVLIPRSQVAHWCYLRTELAMPLIDRNTRVVLAQGFAQWHLPHSSN